MSPYLTTSLAQHLGLAPRYSTHNSVKICANFHNPYATVEVVEGIEAYMKKYNVADIHELIGCVK